MATVYEGYSNKEPNDHRAKFQVKPEILQARFLELYPLTGHIHKTCHMLGIVPRTFYHWKKSNPDFAAKLEEVQEQAIDMLKDEVVRRAVHGVEKPVYQGGKLVGFVTEYSDTLLLKLLQSLDPKNWKDKFQGELTGPNGQPLLSKIEHVHTNFALPSSEEEIDQTRVATQTIQDAEYTVIPPPTGDNSSELLNSV